MSDIAIPKPVTLPPAYLSNLSSQSLVARSLQQTYQASQINNITCRLYPLVPCLIAELAVLTDLAGRVAFVFVRIVCILNPTESLTEIRERLFVAVQDCKAPFQLAAILLVKFFAGILFPSTYNSFKNLPGNLEEQTTRARGTLTNLLTRIESQEQDTAIKTESITKLRATLSELDTSITVATQKKLELLETIGTATSQHETLTQELNTLVDRTAILKAVDLPNLEAKLKEVLGDHEKAKGELKATTDELTALMEKRTNSTKTLAAETSLIQKQKELLVPLGQEEAILRRQIDQLKGSEPQLKANKTALENLEGRISQLKGTEKSLQADVKQLENEKKKLEGSTSNLQSLQDKVTLITKDKETLEETAKKLKEEQLSLEKKNQEQSRAKEKLEGEIVNLSTKQKELEILDKKIEEKTKISQGLNLQIQNLKDINDPDSIKNKQAKLDELNENLEKAKQASLVAAQQLQAFEEKKNAAIGTTSSKTRANQAHSTSQ